MNTTILQNHGVRKVVATFLLVLHCVVTLVGPSLHYLPECVQSFSESVLGVCIHTCGHHHGSSRPVAEPRNCDSATIAPIHECALCQRLALPVHAAWQDPLDSGGAPVACLELRAAEPHLFTPRLAFHSRGPPTA